MNDLNNLDIIEGRKSVPTLIAMVVIPAIILIAGLAIFTLFKLKPKTDNQVIESSVAITETVEAGGKEIEVATDRWGLPDYLLTSHNFLSVEQEAKMLEDIEDMFIGQSLSSYPSSKNGFTSDKEKEYEENGILPNPYYVPILREDMEIQIYSIINRLINPIFGEWTELQTNRANIDDDTYNDRLVEYFGDVLDIDALNQLQKGDRSEYISIDYDKNYFDNAFKSLEDTGAPFFVGVLRDDGEIIFNDDGSIDIAITVDYKTGNTSVYKTLNHQIRLVQQDERLVVATP